MATALVLSNNNIALLISCASLLIAFLRLASGSNHLVDPTQGFTEIPINASVFHHDKPYNLPVSKRYSFEHGVHRLWVYSTDKPLYKGSNTKPRSEIRIEGHDYSSGVHQFEGYGYVPSGGKPNAVCIMQIFGAYSHATTLMLRVYDDSLHYYNSDTSLLKNIYNRWFRLNVIHDVDASKVQVYIDGILKLETEARGGKYHYFKFGVYSEEGSSHYMESRWKNIKIFKKLD